MGYSSASDGEITGERTVGEGEKATRTRPRTKDTAVDRRSRARSPLSRSPRPPNLDGAGDDYSYDRHRSRAGALDYGEDSRRPQQQSHGQKRRHEDDLNYQSRNHSDPRRFQARYESRDDNVDLQRRDAYRSDRDAHNRQARHGGYDNRHDNRAPPGKRHQADRYRARSRSPHGSRGNNQAPSRGHRDERQPFDRSATQGREGRGPPPNQHGRSVGHNGPTNGTTASRQHEAAVNEEEVEPVVVDEAKLIEERRKRREALRAKHRGQNAPLLHKALETNAASHPPILQADDSAPSTVASPSEVDTSQAASPASPAVFSVSNDDELANPAQASPDSGGNAAGGPSAADYDPSMDMQETKLREQRVEGLTGAGDYDETKDADQHNTDSLRQANHAPPPTEPREFDMFAEDDDADMFAPEPAAGHKKEDGTQAVRIPEAKQLDRGLLDDWDDPEGYYRIILGELLDGRYHVQTNLGKGVFSAVVRALDTRTDRLVAIKVIRRQESMYKAGMKEIEILQTIAEADPEDKKHMIRLERHFEHKGHLCMVFENLSINLREVLKKFGRDIGINIKAVRSYAQQMFLGLSLLRRCEILHADLKPDNVLVNEARSQLKIADLGSAVSASDNEVTDMLVSRFYRAPEIMLGIRHDYAIDMWSIGCTLFELYTGKICFTGPTNNQMLRAIMECRGKVPNRMLKKAEFWAQHFDPDGTFLSQEVDNVARKEFVRRTNITRPNPSKELKARLFSNAKGLSPADAKELNMFADLLDKCLALDPARRITPSDALKHGFITRAGLNGK